MKPPLTAQAVIAQLDLRPLPEEGGFFRRTYTCTQTIRGRPLATSIFYLVTPESFSALHRVRQDEMFHFYAGDSVDLAQIASDGTASHHRLGLDLFDGDVPQLLVPADVWQGTRLRDGGQWALLGCTVIPGFAWPDFELGQRERLADTYPQHRELIERYTRPPL